MVQLPVYNAAGDTVDTYDIDANELAPRINKQLLHDAVVMYQANLRQGSFRTKSRARVAGSTQKMFRQKGTGRARAGSSRTNVRRGGGMAFAKENRDFSYRLPKKALRTATRMAVASKIIDEQIVIVDELAFDEPKTKEMNQLLKNLPVPVAGATTLIATHERNANVYLSARNLSPKVTVQPVSDLNALSVLKPKFLLITKAALDVLRDATSAAAPAESVAGTEDE
ncbi:MAG: 50S ribosomal protein L4 [Planctomycetaceae bacterium]|nr:50S ribosomal protein L4 [Planctomycetaceae bacterium]